MTQSEWKAWGDRYGFKLSDVNEKAGAFFFVGEGYSRAGFYIPNDAAKAIDRFNGGEK